MNALLDLFKQTTRTKSSTRSDRSACLSSALLVVVRRSKETRDNQLPHVQAERDGLFCAKIFEADQDYECLWRTIQTPSNIVA